MSKDFFGNELPTTEERLALALAARKCVEAGETLPEALTLLEEAEDERLLTFLLNHALLTGDRTGQSDIMKMVVTAVFDQNPEIVKAANEIDGTAFRSIRDYIAKLEAAVHGKDIEDAFYSLCCGQDVWEETQLVDRGTGEIVETERKKIDGHAAVRRAALATQMAIFLDYPDFTDDYIRMLTREKKEEEAREEDPDLVPQGV